MSSSPCTTANEKCTPRAVTTQEAVCVLLHLAGVRATINLRHAVEQDRLYLWEGEIPGAPGRFWVPALYASGPALTEAAAKVAARDGQSLHEALCRMREHRTGLTRDVVALSPFAYVEIDHLPLEEQVRRYEALATWTGLAWTLWVHSGGKSVHAYLAFMTPLRADDPLRLAIQKLLIVCLEGDTRITNPDRVMRLPGYDRAERPQPVLRWDPEARHTAQEVHDRLVRYAEHLGILDVEQAIHALQVAERLDLAARDQGGEAGFELRAHTAHLRATRGDPDADDLDLDLAAAMLGSGGTPAVRSGRSATVSGTSETVVLPASEMGQYAGQGRVGLPCCGGKGRAGVVLSAPWEPVRAYCHRHQVTYLSEGAGQVRLDPSEVEPFDLGDLDSLLPDDEPAGADGAPDQETEAAVVLVDRRVAEIMASHAVLPEAVEPDLDVLEAEWAGDGPSWLFDGNVRASLCGEPLETGADKSGGSTRSGPLGDVERTASDRDVATVRDQVGPEWAHCVRGPFRHTAGGPDLGLDQATSTRLACMSYRCPECGPRMVATLRAAAAHVLVEFEEWMGLAVTVSGEHDAFGRALRRWHGVRPRSRRYLGIGIAPGVVGYVVFWLGEDEAPTGALARHLVRHEADDIPSPAKAIDGMCAQIDLPAWAAHDGRAVILRGCKRLRTQVSHLRDQVLGRSRVHRQQKPDEGRVAIRTYTSTSEVREAAEALALASTEVVEVSHAPRRSTATNTWQTRTTTWGFGDCTPMAGVLRQLVLRGSMTPLGRARAEPAEVVTLLEPQMPKEEDYDIADLLDEMWG